MAHSDTTDSTSRWKFIDDIPVKDSTKTKLTSWADRNLGFNPYEWQIRAAATVLDSKRDQIVIARTGDGKSAVFQLLLATGKTMIVLSPILGLIGEQVAFMLERGISAAGVTAADRINDPYLWEKIRDNHYKVIFMSPEELLNPSSFFWHKMVADKSNLFLRNLAAIVVDEAHIVWKWGDSLFRKEYKNIGDIKAYLPRVPFLLMSATISPFVAAYLHQTLKLMTPTHILKRTIRRKNMRLVCARARANEKCWSDVDFLLPDQTMLPGCIPKTMIFVDDRNSCQFISNYLRARLNVCYTLEQRVQYVSVYTAALEISTRNIIMENFRSGKTRVLVCTDAAGMGMDIPDVQVVIQYRLSTSGGTLSIADLYQRLGRCARDQRIKGLALVFVENKFLLPAEIDEDESANPRYSDYKMAVSFDEKDNVRQFSRHMYENRVKDLKNPFAYLDPGILWFVNTYGCRARAILSAFDDPDTYNETPCGCDNCYFPVRTEFNQAAVPPNITDFNSGQRESAADEFARLADAIPGRTHYGFSMRLSLRYEATCAYTKDLAIEGQLRNSQLRLTESIPNPSRALCKKVKNALIECRQSIFDKVKLVVPNITAGILFPGYYIDKLTPFCRRINTKEELEERLLAGGYGCLNNSILGPYADFIVDAINKVVEEHDNSMDVPVADFIMDIDPELRLVESNSIVQPKRARGRPRKPKLTLTEEQRLQNRRKIPLIVHAESSFDLTTEKGRAGLKRQRSAQRYDREKAEAARAKKLKTDLLRAERAVQKATAATEKKKNKQLNQSQSQAPM